MRGFLTEKPTGLDKFIIGDLGTQGGKTLSPGAGTEPRARSGQYARRICVVAQAKLAQVRAPGAVVLGAERRRSVAPGNCSRWICVGYGLGTTRYKACQTVARVRFLRSTAERAGTAKERTTSRAHRCIPSHPAEPGSRLAGSTRTFTIRSGAAVIEPLFDHD